MGQGNAQPGGGPGRREPRAAVVRNYHTNIGRVTVATDWPALQAVFASRCVWRALEEAREVAVEVRLAPAAEAAAFREAGPHAPEAQPRTIAVLDAGFALARDGLAGIMPDHLFGGGLVLEWLWRALPILCAPDGWEAVHAAAVARDGEATLLLGESGSGKTTALLHFLSHGYALLSDDLVLVHRGRGTVRGWEGLLRLWPDQAAQWGLDSRTLDFCGKVLAAPPGVILSPEAEVPLGRCLALAEEGGELDFSHAGAGFDSEWRPRCGAREWLLERAEWIGRRPQQLPATAPSPSRGRGKVAVCTPFAGKHQVLGDWLEAFQALALPKDAAVLWCCNTEDEAFWQRLQAAAAALGREVILWRDTHRLEAKDHQVAYLWQQLRARIPEDIDYVLCLEDDVLPEAQAFASLAAVQARFGEKAVVALPVPYLYPASTVSFMAWRLRGDRVELAPPGLLPAPVEAAAFGCTLFPRALFDELSLQPDQRGRAHFGYDQCACEEVAARGGLVVAAWGLAATHVQGQRHLQATLRLAAARTQVVLLGEGLRPQAGAGWEIVGEEAGGAVAEVARRYPSARAMVLTQPGVTTSHGYLTRLLDELERHPNLALAHGRCALPDGALGPDGTVVLRAEAVRESGASDLAEFRRYANREGWEERRLEDVVCHGLPSIALEETRPTPDARREASLRVVLVNRNPETDPEHAGFGGDLVHLDGWKDHLPHYGILAAARPAGWRCFEPFDAILLLHAQFDWSRRLLAEDRGGRPLVVAAMTHGRPSRDTLAPVIGAAARVLCYTEAEADFYRELLTDQPKDKFRVVPLGVARELYEYCARRDPPPSKGDIFMAGRLCPHKGQERVLQACRELDVPVTFAGGHDRAEPNYANKLRHLAEGWDGLTIKPLLSGEELWEEYRRAWVHVNASAFEPFGLTTYEALAAGCNVVHTKESWAAGMFEQVGSLCDPLDVDSIGRALEQELLRPRGRHKFYPPTWLSATRGLAAVLEEVALR